ncbi:hypothetical protein FEM48_Zijuj03G0062400 [Ziziphus jujuba var. spinosa]|uniref:BED-type domain-containing protein n=1 Tax=Ziziphus jujuba var. spinosa TaxID=714518 RepID=A0A978VNN4_ZIZJJ|nr:hypothetical protein FEM48_Zijuj03G0062400 [Ziziphus jujuba var. spinosa]
MASGLEPVPITSQKHDPAWKHCQMFKIGDRVQLRCIYCSKLFKGGGIHRIKEHLAGQKGNASTCLRVPPDVRALMQQSLDGVVVKKRNRQKLDEEITNINPRPHSELESLSHHGDDVNTGLQFGSPDALEHNSGLLVIREEGTTSSRSTERRKRGRGKASSAHDAAGLINSAVLGSKKVSSNIHMAIGRFLYDIGAPLDAVNSAYFQPMVDAIASGGLGVVLPSYHDLRGWILKNSVEEVRSDIDKYRAFWERTGCSILVDHVEGDLHNDILSGMFDCIERLVPDTKVQDKIIKEMNSYKTAAGDFGRKMAMRTRDTLLPAEWWSTYGGGCPNLARLAIRILSQTCSSIRCKHNRVPFEKMYETGNCLEHQRLSDLVFVQYNLQLRQMVDRSNGQDSIDPISFDCVGVVEDWVRMKDMCLDDHGDTDWTALDPPSANTMLLGPPNDDADDLGAGFDDYEVFSRLKESEEENGEDNVIIQ